MRDIDLTKEKDNCDRYKSGHSEIDGNGIATMMMERRLDLGRWVTCMRLRTSAKSSVSTYEVEDDSSCLQSSAKAARGASQFLTD